MQEEIKESQSNLTSKKPISSDRDKKAEMFELTEDILCSATSAVDVLNDLLNYDKVEMGTLSLERTILPIWDSDRAYLGRIQANGQGQKIDFKLDFSEVAEKDEESPSTIHLSQDIRERRVFGDAIV
jgi:hypothetical protein